MKYQSWIFFVNRYDLLKKAVASVRSDLRNLTILDNSPEKLLHQKSGLGVPEYPPPFSFTYVESTNFALSSGLRSGDDFVITMHNDAEALGESANVFLGKLNELVASGRKWGQLKTNYDALTAYNLAFVRECGLMDNFFSMYFADNDYFYRMKLAGYEIVEMPEIKDKIKHEVSSTLKAGFPPRVVHDIKFALYQQYYKMKWGAIFLRKGF